MENSIEEDIKKAEHFIKTIKTDIKYVEENCWHVYYDKEIVEIARILQNILSDYKRVLKENELAKQEYDRDTHILQNQLDLANVDKIDLAQQNKELRKENEALKVLEDDIQDKRIVYIDTPEFKENYIPIQKIKDKIEEINKMIAYEHNDAVIIQLGKQKRVLQKLLESEE